MQRARWEYLLKQVYDQNATAEEQAALQEALRNAPPGEPDETLMDDLMAKHTTVQALAPAAADALFNDVLSRLQEPVTARKTRVVPFRWQWAAAAVFLLMGGAGAYHLLAPTAIKVNTIARADVMPGTNKAVLTLADGSHVALDSTGQQVILQGNTAIRQNHGALLYEAGSTADAITWNTLSTPRGGQFRLVLPDGTTVWLNAASSVRYPTAFSGKERQVIVTGEAYFEVAPMAGKPFRVSLPSGVTIDVLGTSFNVNAYTEENSIQTTLADGKVQVSQGQSKALLQPGAQAAIVPGQTTIAVTRLSPARLSQVLAWKNGIFDFEQVDLETAMRQIARWYDVQVIYKGAIPHRLFGGELSRSLRLSDIVEVMHMMKVNVTIEEGKKLIIQPS
ncbi:FecR family protein [Chitinophaga arvensicola]|uniref:FecR protein n=1 Tax=Chitinophaga arvensicola TaxID=29529 RepID=A0A1I0RTN1_9BACT|nr:FecR family protein [Chitinophaga arvensicola]SEW44664.1 protein of unknown function [Chitinophaga arvensicola]